MFQTEEVLLCGTMKQSCMHYIEFYKSAEKYKITILTDCSTIVDDISSSHDTTLHNLLHRISHTSSQQVI
ncbi:hypothetical protein [Candidatus Nitrosacidococcus sp. I8]|uniref:hypothetical protein n=1 Tax=Candidatus Nitrosacidococcus sp. I8 TaxID=2942908 RepID=UPI0022274CA3|nr:hypothetical protein [Candidatus Nitrosacidococcus sp. I8]